MTEARGLTDVWVGMQLACERSLCLLKDLSEGPRLVTDTQDHLPVRPGWQPTSRT
jgi:hypothetical protein